MEHDLAEEAQRRARALGFTFSAYVVQLIRKDLSHRGAMVVQEEKHAPEPTPPRQDVTYPKPSKKKKP